MGVRKYYGAITFPETPQLHELNAFRLRLMQGPKNGFFYVIDRKTGELISAEPFVDIITWASHVYKSNGRPVETNDARKEERGQI